MMRLLALIFRALDGLSWRVREQSMRSGLGRVGRNFVFDPVTSKFVTPAQLRVGDDCFLNAHAHISGDVTLGDRVLVGPGVKLLSGNHLYGIEGYHARFLKASEGNPELLEPLVVESDVWIGANAIVLGGVTLGEGCVLAAGAIATRNVPPYVVAAGVPALPLRRIFDDDHLLAHLRTLGVHDTVARTVVERRACAGASGLPVANPPRPATFLYAGRWVGDPAESESPTPMNSA